MFHSLNDNIGQIEKYASYFDTDYKISKTHQSDTSEIRPL